MTFFSTRGKTEGIKAAKNADPELNQFCRLVANRLGKKLKLITGTDIKEAVMTDPVYGPRLKKHPNTTGTIANWKEFRQTDQRRNTGSHDREQVVWEYIGDQPQEKETDMARKPKTGTKAEENPRAWHEKAMTAFMDQVGAGDGLKGYTFSEIRKTMDLKSADTPGFSEVAAAISELRAEGFLAHKFTHPSLAEDFYEGDPTDIPNTQKRENDARVRQLVFFVHPAATALGDAVMAAVTAGEYPEGHEYETGSTVFDRDMIFEWFDGLGEIIDLHVTDEDHKALSAKMIAALMPAKA